MGLLDYYRQFEDMEEAEVNAALRARRAREKALALERVPVLDLSHTGSPDLPNAEVVGASVYQARGRLNGYPDERARAINRALAERHYIRGEQIVLGNGAAELLRTAAYLLLDQGSELLSPWPSYSLYPTIATRAGARFVEAELADGFVDPAALLAQVGDRTRMIVISNPNDPTGTYIESGQVGELLSRLPEHTYLALDEAYVHFQDVEDEDASMRLVEAFPRLLVFRTFSKAWGLAGLRCGYAVGGPGAESLLAQLEPELGLNELAQAGALEALRTAARVVAGRAAAVAGQRARLAAAVRDLGYAVAPSQANVLWIAASGVDGAELHRRLERQGVIAAPGGPLGDPSRIRLTVPPSRETADRALRALERAATTGSH
jgi:histidinol-phosphate aminotransferase